MARTGLCIVLHLVIAFAVLPVNAAEPTLRIEGVAGRDGVAKPALNLSAADLAAMPRVTATVKGRDGKEHTSMKGYCWPMS